MTGATINSNYPKLPILVLIAVTLLLLTALNKCVAQVPVDKDVLNYLFQQSAKAYYLEKDLKLTDSIIVAQKDIITSKDTIIAGQSERLLIEKSKNDLCDIQLISANAENKKLHKSVSLFKFTTISVAVLGGITTLYAILH